MGLPGAASSVARACAVVNFRRRWKQLDEVQLTRLVESLPSPSHEPSLGRAHGIVSDSLNTPAQAKLGRATRYARLEGRSAPRCR